jgi:FKBP-type peptidyl-prolyl cis-trans isomerase
MKNTTLMIRLRSCGALAVLAGAFGGAAVLVGTAVATPAMPTGDAPATGAAPVSAASPVAAASPKKPAASKKPAAAAASAAPATSSPATTAAPADAASSPPQLSNAEASYLFGINSGDQMRAAGINDKITLDEFIRGVKDGLAGKYLTAADQPRMRAFIAQVQQEAGARNKAEAQAFLAKNALEKGVKTTPSGLQYRILIPGDSKAASPAPSDEVTVHYRGKLLNGTEFDSSYAHGKPVTFMVGGVIKGWQEALGLMKPGSKWQLFVPPELAYDMHSQQGIPAGSLLIFDVELLVVKPLAAPGAVPAPGTDR